MSVEARALFSKIVLPRLEEGFRLARWLTGNPTDAEDVLQESCLRAYKAIDNFADGNARAWFLTIVRNSAYSWLQRQRPQALVFVEDAELTTQSAHIGSEPWAMATATPETALIEKQDLAKLAKTIDGLPVPMREVLVLREHHGFSYRQIAEVSGLPIGTVMSRLARARSLLLARFEGEEQ